MGDQKTDAALAATLRRPTEWTLQWFNHEDRMVVEVKLNTEQVATIRQTFPDWDGAGCQPITVYFGEWHV